jgi:L-threonylcarbamoyladenylate synthase
MESGEVQRAVAILREGGLVALPTETVYGLAADAENELAVRRIFAVKGRPASHPLIVHLAGATQAQEWASHLNESARRLMEAFWPGPLTLVVPRSGRASDAVTGGQGTVALRVPAHPMAWEVLERFGGGLAAPSANRFGGVSPTTATHVREDLGDDVELILDGGPCAVGLESTIIDVSGEAPALLRPGGTPLEAVERVLGRPVELQSRSAVRAPGMLASHYAPRAGVVASGPSELYARAEALVDQGRRVAVLAPADQPLPGGATLLAVPAQAEGLARVLYASLREVDERGFNVVVVLLPPREGLGLAVLDRLARAAAPRS